MWVLQGRQIIRRMQGILWLDMALNGTDNPLLNKLKKIVQNLRLVELETVAGDEDVSQHMHCLRAVAYRKKIIVYEGMRTSRETRIRMV